MRYERLHLFWDYYDGVRTGIADLDGAPHYFACRFDESAGNYSEKFELYPVGPEFMRRAMRQEEIYATWERKFRAGEVGVETHPGHGGIDTEYDALKSWLDDEIRRTPPLPSLYRAEFSTGGLEVAWSPD